MGDVVHWHGITTLPTGPEEILRRAREAGLTSVVVVGFTDDGGEFFASSEADGAQALWQLERAKHRLMTIVDRIAGDED